MQTCSKLASISIHARDLGYKTLKLEKFQKHTVTYREFITGLLFLAKRRWKSRKLEKKSTPTNHLSLRPNLMSKLMSKLQKSNWKM